MIVSFWLVRKHLQWYTNKREQRCKVLQDYYGYFFELYLDIVRLLFMVPLYAIISFASFIFWNHSTPLILVRDAYEAIVLTAFFYLLLMYLSHDDEEQKRIFMKAGLSKEADKITLRKRKKLAKWVFPLSFVKWKPKDGLYFLQLMKWGVLQYCVIRPTTTLAAVVLDYMGLYCESSWGLGWGHIWIMIVISLSVTIAMFCLIQLYVVVAKELAPHKPLLKLFSVKAVVFLTFWQATFLSLLSMMGVIKGSDFMTAEDINIGIGAVLETFEMMLFAFLHIKAFTYKPYREPIPPDLLPPSQTPQWRSLGHAMDFRETFREIWVGCVYLIDKARGREPKPDFKVRRTAHYEGAFGRSREQRAPVESSHRSHDSQEDINALVFPSVEVHIDQAYEVEGRRQWLGLGPLDHHIGIGHPRRDRSEGLQVRIDRELEKLGHPTAYPEPLERLIRYHDYDGPPVTRLPWWRTVYNRLSITRQEAEIDNDVSANHQRLRSLLTHEHQASPYDIVPHNYHTNNGYDTDAHTGVLSPSKHRPARTTLDAEVCEQISLLTEEPASARTSGRRDEHQVLYAPKLAYPLPFSPQPNLPKLIPITGSSTSMPDPTYGTGDRYGPVSRHFATNIIESNPPSQISPGPRSKTHNDSQTSPISPPTSRTNGDHGSRWLRSLIHPKAESEFAEAYQWSPHLQSPHPQICIQWVHPILPPVQPPVIAAHLHETLDDITTLHDFFMTALGYDLTASCLYFYVD
ncbi:organic solute transporter Ostalpha-domain-containing protein [Panaeolus papilionaceus]|nr:organic solute transporter Ostalpha-domain-containing protein [Panaeolus papilionaceus]